MSWNITGCSKQCIHCMYIFKDQDLYHCKLIIGDDGPERQDCCEECWDKIKDSNKNEFSYWQGKYRQKPIVAKEEPIKESVSKKLLKKWIQSPERLHKCFCYILILMLERKKLFSPKPSIKTEDGKKQLVYEEKDTGEVYILEDPALTLKELGAIESQLQEMMKRELQEEETQEEENQEEDTKEEENNQENLEETEIEENAS